MRNSSSNDRVCPICKGAGYLAKDVPVGHPDFGKLYPCQCKIEELEAKRLLDLQDLSQLGALSRMTFQSFKSEGVGLNTQKRENLRRAYERAKHFAEESVGWLVLKGGYGCGKTHLAAAISNYRIANGQPVLFVVVPDLLDHLRATYAPTSEVSYDERFEEVRTAPLLILDDLGTQSSTPWAQEKLYQILNYRYNARLPTVITTNRELEEIDLRLRSRLVDPDLTEIVGIIAPDFRGSSTDRGQSELSSLSLHNSLPRRGRASSELSSLPRSTPRIPKTGWSSPALMAAAKPTWRHLSLTIGSNAVTQPSSRSFQTSSTT